ncbi:MAG: PqqD family protein [Acidobacteria bacterium]|nr:PqqD family protein [Acidobacteriota bacterium]
MHLRINSPTVIHETMDDEVVIIHFESGAYFNLRQTGAEIWNMIGAGHSVEDIIRFYQRRHANNGKTVEQAVHSFVDSLQREDLVVLHDASGQIPAGAVSDPAGDDAGEFLAPSLEKYSDMQDLLLLDPIHEVDADGWPHRREESDDVTPD